MARIKLSISVSVDDNGSPMTKLQRLVARALWRITTTTDLITSYAHSPRTEADVVRSN